MFSFEIFTQLTFTAITNSHSISYSFKRVTEKEKKNHFWMIEKTNFPRDYDYEYHLVLVVEMRFNEIPNSLVVSVKVPFIVGWVAFAFAIFFLLLLFLFTKLSYSILFHLRYNIWEFQWVFLLLIPSSTLISLIHKVKIQCWPADIKFFCVLKRKF